MKECHRPIGVALREVALALALIGPSQCTERRRLAGIFNQLRYLTIYLKNSHVLRPSPRLNRPYMHESTSIDVPRLLDVVVAAIPSPLQSEGDERGGAQIYEFTN
jgi:hypothetical protein